MKDIDCSQVKFFISHEKHKLLKTHWILLLSLFIWTTSYSQNKSYLQFIRFNSAFEEESWSKENLDYITLLLSTDSTITINEVSDFKNKLDDFYSNNTFSNKSGKRRIKAIEALYLSIHDVFLERFRENIDFSGLVRKKEFNCVTASILYAEILNHYGIPFVILNEPNHVSLIAYPEEEYVVLQTTSPNFKDFQVTEKVRRKIVNDLLGYKAITQREIDTLGLNIVYEINNNGQNRVTINELIGYDYHNKSIFTIEDSKDYVQSVQYAMRAMYLIPDSKEINQFYADVAQYSLINTTGLDSSSLQLRLMTLDEVIYNHLNSKGIIQSIVAFWFYQRLHKAVDNKEIFNAHFLLGMNFRDLYNGDYEGGYEEDYEDESSDLDIYEYEERMMEIVIKDLPLFENNINEFVETKKWNHGIKIKLFEMIIDMLMFSEDSLTDTYLIKLKEVDPKNKIVRLTEIGNLFDEFDARIKENPLKYASIIEEFKIKGAELELSEDRLIRFELEVFSDFQRDCIELFYQKKRKAAKPYFDACLSIYNNCKDDVSEAELDGMNYDLGYLYVSKANSYTGAERRRILKEGLRVLPDHVVLNASYKGHSNNVEFILEKN